jgi:hypothetical protein
MTKEISRSNQANNGVPTNQGGISRGEAIALSSAPNSQIITYESSDALSRRNSRIIISEISDDLSRSEMVITPPPPDTNQTKTNYNFPASAKHPVEQIQAQAPASVEQVQAQAPASVEQVQAQAPAQFTATTEDRIPKATAQANCFSACFAGILGLFNSTSRNFNLDNTVSVSAQLTNDSTNNQVTTVSSSPNARVQPNRVAVEVIAIGSNTSRTIFV